MVCENCHQNEATVRFTHVVNQQTQVMHLCQKCAKSPPGASGGITISVKGLEIQVSEREMDDLACARCGMTFLEFQDGGLFGCPDCYVAFGPRLQRLMKRIHGAAVHVATDAGDAGSATDSTPAGAPSASGGEESIEALEGRLQAAVAEEAFEEAAGLRDRISRLKSGPTSDSQAAPSGKSSE